MLANADTEQDNADVSYVNSEQFRANINSIADRLNLVLEAADKDQQLRINHLERLTLLDAGTLTLTFTILGIFGSHLSQHGHAVHGGYLFSAWWLLAVSMTCCIIAQLIGISLLTHRSVYAHMALAKIPVKLLGNVTGMNAEALAGTIVSLQQIEKTTDRMEKQFEPRGRWFTGMFYGGHLTMLAAFILLLLFVQTNIGQMLF